MGLCSSFLRKQESKGVQGGFRDGRVAELLDLKPEQVLAVGKYQKTVAARSLLCLWATSELGISQSELGQMKKWCQEMTPKSHLLSVKRLNKTCKSSFFLSIFFIFGI